MGIYYGQGRSQKLINTYKNTYILFADKVLQKLNFFFFFRRDMRSFLMDSTNFRWLILIIFNWFYFLLSITIYLASWGVDRHFTIHQINGCRKLKYRHYSPPTNWIMCQFCMHGVNPNMDQSIICVAKTSSSFGICFLFLLFFLPPNLSRLVFRKPHQGEH